MDPPDETPETEIFSKLMLSLLPSSASVACCWAAALGIGPANPPSRGTISHMSLNMVGLSGYAAPTRHSSLIGSYVMATAEHREPCESRGSCTVLGAPGGEIPPGDSTDPPLDRRADHGGSPFNSRRSTPCVRRSADRPNFRTNPSSSWRGRIVPTAYSLMASLRSATPMARFANVSGPTLPVSLQRGLCHNPTFGLVITFLRPGPNGGRSSNFGFRPVYHSRGFGGHPWKPG